MSRKSVTRVDPLTLALPLGGVDSHAHLDGEEFDQDREAVLTRARAVGLSQIGNIFQGPEAFAAGRGLFDAHPEVFFVLGVHPCEGQRCTPACLAAMDAAFAAEPRLRAVGEIGLDFHWPDCPREIQLQAFADQLDLARARNLPVVIHCRDAEDEALTLLEARGFAGYPLLWHCFGVVSTAMGEDLARRLAHNGWHISVPGPITYKANENLRQAVPFIPADRLLLETDAPYLAPHPWRGQRNEPAFTVFTAQALAAASDEDPARLWRRCGDNARRFFGLTTQA